MPVRKIDLIQLQALKDAGKTQADIVRETGWSKAAVCKNWRGLSMGIAQDVTLRSAGQIVTRKLNAFDRLNRAARVIESELDYIEGKLPRATGDDRKDLVGSRLSHLAEERKQITSLVDVAKAFYNIEEVKEFQKIILDVIGEVDKEARNEIIRKLRERRSVRRVLGEDGLGIL